MPKEKKHGTDETMPTDYFVYNGDLSRRADFDLISLIDKKKRSNRCVLLLVTMGGSPHAAYKIGKYIQSKYDSFAMLVSGLCKSAGTLVAIAAKEIVFTPYGELGPLDVQMVVEDKIALESGLNLQEALYTFEDHAADYYHKLVAEILTTSGNVPSFHTASDLAAALVIGLYEPIFGKFDPEELGSTMRAMRIAEDYGKRLNLRWRNLRQGALNLLSQTYPDHEFVIDYSDAETLFQRVRRANDDELRFVQRLGKLARIPSRRETVTYYDSLSDCTNNQGDTHDSETRPTIGAGPARTTIPKNDGGDSSAPERSESAKTVSPKKSES